VLSAIFAVGILSLQSGSVPARADTQSLRMVVQSGKVYTTSVEWFPDGRYLVSTGGDRAARIYDVESGLELLRDFHPEGAEYAVISPNSELMATVPGTSSRYDASSAVLWNLSTLQRVHVLSGHRDYIRHAAFSPDGTLLATASDDRTSRLYSTVTGNEVLRLDHGSGVTFVQFSPDGTVIASSADDGTVRIWELSTGRELRVIKGHSDEVFSARFSSDGTKIVSVSRDDTIRIYDLVHGAEKLKIPLSSSRAIMSSVSFSGDDTQVIAGLSVYCAESGALIRSAEGNESFYATSSATQPGGNLVATSVVDLRNFEAEILVWNPNGGQEVRSLGGKSSAAYGVSFAPKGLELMVGLGSGASLTWDFGSKAGPRLAKGDGTPIVSVDHSPDEKLTAAGSDGGHVFVYDSLGQNLQTLDARGRLFSTRFSADSTILVSGTLEGAVIFWNPLDGEKVNEINAQRPISWLSLSHDRKRVALLDEDTNDPLVYVIEVATGAEVQRLADFRRAVNTIEFSPDDKHLLVATSEDGLELWDLESGNRAHSFGDDGSETLFGTYSPSGKWVLSTHADGTAALWNAQTRELIRRYEGHSGPVYRGAISPDELLVATASTDGTIRLWDALSDKEHCTLIALSDDSWAVVDPEGRYDVSSDDVKGIHWVMDMTPVDLHAFKDKYYDPGLLAKKLGYSNEKPRTVPPLSEIKFAPKSKINLSADAKRANITIEDRGGGIGKFEVVLNGAVIYEGSAPPGATEHELSIDLASHARRLVPAEHLLENERNILEVIAGNAAGSLKGRGEPVGLPPPSESVAEPPKVFILSVGVSDYQGDKQDLLFAAKDAKDVSAALSLSASRLFGPDRVDVKTLVTDLETENPDDFRASKRNIVNAIKRIAEEAKSTDVVIIYFAGHGRAGLGNEEEYYFLTDEAGTIDLSDAASREVATIKGSELARLLGEVAAAKRALILDTCGSGQFADDATRRRSVTSEMRRAWETMKDRSGVFILAGCAADQVSYEASNIAQGILTYSLLEPLNKLDPEVLERTEDGNLRIGIVRWFESAERRVGELIRELQLGGVQHPQFKARAGARTFPIGALAPEDVGRVPLASPKPIVLLRTFADTEDSDPLFLESAIRDKFVQMNARSGSFVFWREVREHPNALAVSGTYTRSGDVVVVDVRVLRFKKTDTGLLREPFLSFKVEGSARDLPSLVERIIQELSKRI